MKRIAAVVQEALELKQIPGAVVLVIVNGRTVYHEAFGQAMVEPDPNPMGKDTIFDLASLTKPLATGLALMLLVDQAILSLRDRVARWLPQFTSGRKDEVTLLDLLTHSGGLDDAGLYDARNPMVTTANVLELLWDKGLYAPPGTAYRYADYNYITLGKVVEAAGGEPLDVFFTRHIARPLGLKDTGFKPPGKKRNRIAPTEIIHGRQRRGEVHDPRAHMMGGVAGHAGLFSTAQETSVIPCMLLNAGKWKHGRLLSSDAAAVMTSIQTPPGLHPRMIGWDTDPAGLGPRGELFSSNGFGHTGFTGTSIWADKPSQTVVVILTNRVHPDGQGSADPLRRRVANIVAEAVLAAPGVVVEAPGKPEPAEVLCGIDVLERETFASLQGKRIGLMTNLSVLNRRGVPTLDVLAQAPGVKLAAIFTPEHGLEATLDEHVPSGQHEQFHIPVHSLYGESRRPSTDQFKELDALVVDLPDIGARFYTYPATLGYCMEEAAKVGLSVILLDRPNPLTGLHVEGPRLPQDRFGFTGYTSLPVRHGMTLGELGRLFNQEHRIGAKLEVVTMKGWRREMWFDDTGLPWANPSPNIRSLTQAILYPAVGLLEATNLSVGRGTDAPFERFGAPWLDGAAVARQLNDKGLPGIRFYPVTFTPESGPYAGKSCGGCALQLTDRDVFRAVETGVAIADALHRLHGEAFKLEGLDHMIGVSTAREQLLQLLPPSDIAAGWRKDEEEFETFRKIYLLY